MGGADEKLQSWQISWHFFWLKVSIGMSVLEMTAAENPFNRDYPSVQRRGNPHGENSFTRLESNVWPRRKISVGRSCLPPEVS